MTAPITGFLQGLMGGFQSGYGLRTDIEDRKIAGRERERRAGMEASDLKLRQAAELRAAVAAELQGQEFDYRVGQDFAARKRQSFLDKQPGPEVLEPGIDPTTGKPSIFAFPRGAPPRNTGVAPVPSAQREPKWQTFMDYSGRYGPAGQAVQINPESGEVRPIAAQGRVPTTGTGLTASMRMAVSENEALIGEIDNTIKQLEANPQATGFFKGLAAGIPFGEFALAGLDPAGDTARQGVGLQRSKVLHDFIGGAQTRIELKNLKGALPADGFSTSTNIKRLQALRDRAARANAAMTGSAPPGIASPGPPGGTVADPEAWAGGDPERLQFLREQGVIR